MNPHDPTLVEDFPIAIGGDKKKATHIFVQFPDLSTTPTGKGSRPQ